MIEMLDNNRNNKIHSYSERINDIKLMIKVYVYKFNIGNWEYCSTNFKDIDTLVYLANKFFIMRIMCYNNQNQNKPDFYLEFVEANTGKLLIKEPFEPNTNDEHVLVKEMIDKFKSFQIEVRDVKTSINGLSNDEILNNIAYSLRHMQNDNLSFFDKLFLKIKYFNLINKDS